MFTARSLVCIHISLGFGSSVVFSAEFSLGLSFGFTLGFTACASSNYHLYNRSRFVFSLGSTSGCSLQSACDSNRKCLYSARATCANCTFEWST